MCVVVRRKNSEENMLPLHKQEKGFWQPMGDLVTNTALRKGSFKHTVDHSVTFWRTYGVK